MTNDEFHSGPAAPFEPAGEQVKPELLTLDEGQRARFEAKIDKTSSPHGCWLWTAAIIPNGYGYFGIKKGMIRYAHRISYTIHNGPIPDGLFVCHNCPGGDNPACQNPEHLWLGTALQNALDRETKGRGLQASGENHYAKKTPEKIQGKKLTREQVYEIRRLSDAGIHYEILAVQFKINRVTAWQIVNRRIWAHLPIIDPTTPSSEPAD